ncbi:MAG: hypothetical protein ACE3L7_32440 [Candidatus Pristimantibacillus sp.]
MLPKYPHTVVGHVFYQDSQKNLYYELFERIPRKEISLETFQKLKSEYNIEGIPVYIMDDKQIELLFDVWKQSPSTIDVGRLNFYYAFGAITSQLYTEYTELHLRHKSS